MKIRYRLAAIFVTAFAVACCFALTGCGYCQHKLIEIPKEPSTCVTEGLRTAYECEKCGKMFGYSDEKGLYGIKEREAAPLGKHTTGMLELVRKEGSTAFADMKAYAICAECEERFELDKEGLIPFTPSDSEDDGDVAVAKHVRDGDYAATEFTFAANTVKGAVHIIKPLNDSGTDPRAYVNVPFDAQTSRFLVVAVYNTSNTDVDITYGAECYGERCVSPKTTVPAGGCASLAVDLKFSRTQPRSYHELTMFTDLSAPVTLRILGYYYSNEKVKSIALTAKGRTDYASGEKLDTDGIAITASYENNVTRVLSPDEYTINLAGKALTAKDTKVVITYKKKTFSYNITVQNVTRGENYARGKTATASEKGFSPAGFGLGKLTDGQFDDYNAWGSAAHKTATETVWVQIDLGSVKEFNDVVLFARHDGCYFPKAYRIEVSADGENFTAVHEEKSDPQAATFGIAARNCRFDEVSARYVRIVATEMTNSTGGSYYFELAEIEVYKVADVETEG